MHLQWKWMGQSVNIKLLSIDTDVYKMHVKMIIVWKLLTNLFCAKLNPILQLCCHDNATP